MMMPFLSVSLLLALLITFTECASNSSKNANRDTINYFDGSLLKENQYHFVSQKSDFCGVIVPGLQLMTRGVDIARLDLLHDYNADHDDGFAVCSFIELTCKKKRKLRLDGVEYDVPDQVLSIDLLPRDSLKTHLGIINNLDEARNELKGPLGMLDRPVRGLFSESGSYKSYQRVILNGTKFLATLQVVTPSTRINLAPRTSLRKSLTEFMSDFLSEEMPKKYRESPDKFQEFIQNYGTHYFKSAMFGGVFSHVTQVDQSVREFLSDREIRQNINMYFMALLSRKGVVSKVFEKKDNKSFREKLTTNQSYYGGDAFLLEIDRYENWLPSLPRNPWLVSGQLAPITELIRNETLKAELDTAIQVHLGLAYIQDCKRILNAQMKKFPSKVTKISPLIDKIERMISSSPPLPEQVDLLIRELESVKYVVKLFNAIR